MVRITKNFTLEEGTWFHLSYRKGHNRKENLLYRNKRYIKDN